MLEKLTKEQEALMPVVRDEWIKFCLGGDTSINQEECIEGIHWFYSLSKLKNPSFIAFAEGPLAAQMIANIFPNVLKAVEIKKPSVGNSVGNSVWNSVENSVKNSVENSVRNSVENSVRNSVENSVGNSVENSVKNSVRNSVKNSVRNSVENSVRNSVENSVENSVWNSVGNSVGNSVWNSVENSVRNSVENSVWNSVENSVRKFEYPYCGLGWWAGWFSFFDFFERLGIFHPDFKRFKKWVKSGAWDVLWFEDLCVITCRPSEVKKNAKDQLHCENGPAAKWPSGEEYYFLNGINVSQELVMTEAGKIDPQLALTEKSVDVQREIIRKVGAERMLKACNAETLDVFMDKHTKGGNEYKLMRMKVGQIDRKYLYFEHASLPGVWYAQPVNPALKRALHARAWILGGEIEELERMSDKEIIKKLPVSVS